MGGRGQITKNRMRRKTVGEEQYNISEIYDWQNWMSTPQVAGLCVWPSCWETSHHSSSHYRGLLEGRKIVVRHTFAKSHHWTSMPRVGPSERANVFIGGALRPLVTAVDLGDCAWSGATVSQSPGSHSARLASCLKLSPKATGDTCNLSPLLNNILHLNCHL